MLQQFGTPLQSYLFKTWYNHIPKQYILQHQKFLSMSSLVSILQDNVNNNELKSNRELKEMGKGIIHCHVHTQ